MKIAVIGGGLSGSLAAIYMVKETAAPVTVYLFEKKSEQLNKGVAYSSVLPHQLLNVPVREMSLFADEPEHFYTWLKKNKYSYDPLDFAPRNVYGAYIKDTYTNETKTRKDCTVNVIISEVTSIKKVDEVYQVKCRGNEVTVVDKILLCTGNFPPGDVTGLSPEVKESGKYISHPWGGFEIKSVQPVSDILMIGSGLTMTDLVLSLERNNHKGKITVLSRRGLLPLPHGYSPDYVPESLPVLNNVTVSSLLRWIKENVNKAVSEGKNWRSVIDSLRPYISSIWAALPPDQKKSFLNHMRPFWEIHRHRMPVESLTLFKQMQQDGRLNLVAGRIKHSAINEDKIIVTYSCRNTSSLRTLVVDNIINCTGPDKEYHKIHSELYQHLVENKMVQRDPFSLGLQVTANGFIVAPGGNVNPDIAVIGPPAKGVLWESTALLEIRTQAAWIAKAILRKT